jgi:hypothetical protein
MGNPGRGVKEVLREPDRADVDWLRLQGRGSSMLNTRSLSATANIALVCAAASVVLVCCAPTVHVLTKCDYLYQPAQVSGDSLYYARPVVRSATVMADGRTQRSDAAEIGQGFHQSLGLIVRRRGLGWRSLNDSLAGVVRDIRTRDTCGDVRLDSSAAQQLLNGGVRYVLLIHDIVSSHERRSTATPIVVPVAPGIVVAGRVEKTGVSHKLRFTYKCSIIDVRRRATILNAKLQEKVSTELSFYDDLCSHLLTVLLGESP